jgi:4-hydroxy-2-oxoheptanedioate aldolase
LRLPANPFKKALAQGQPQIGLWLGFASSYTGELLAGVGFDWLVVDAEHSPNDPKSVLSQLQAIAPYAAQAVVRPVSDDVALLKQYLDVGAQTLLIPMIDTPEQAARVVAATRYPPRGVRGVGSALARASRWSQVDDYLHQCESELCILVQVETTKGIENLSGIAHTEGVDGVFFGPSDLAASMGLLGRSNDSAVQNVITRGIQTVTDAGKAAGVLCTDPAIARKYLDLGAKFVAVGLDTLLLVTAARGLLSEFR